MTDEAVEITVTADRYFPERKLITVSHGRYASSLSVSAGELLRIRNAVDAYLAAGPADTTGDQP